MRVHLATGIVTRRRKGIQGGIGVLQSVGGVLRDPIDDWLYLGDPGKGHVVRGGWNIEPVRGDGGTGGSRGAPRGRTGGGPVEGGVDLEPAGEQEREACRHLAAFCQLLLVDVSFGAELGPLCNGSADRVHFRFGRRRGPLAAAHASGRKGRRDARLLCEQEQDADAERPRHLLRKEVAAGVDGEATGRKVDGDGLGLDRLQFVIPDLKGLGKAALEEVGADDYAAVSWEVKKSSHTKRTRIEK